jgi:hypothetical protein
MNISYSVYEEGFGLLGGINEVGRLGTVPVTAKSPQPSDVSSNP